MRNKVLIVLFFLSTCAHYCHSAQQSIFDKTSPTQTVENIIQKINRDQKYDAAIHSIAHVSGIYLGSLGETAYVEYVKKQAEQRATALNNQRISCGQLLCKQSGTYNDKCFYGTSILATRQVTENCVVLDCLVNKAEYDTLISQVPDSSITQQIQLTDNTQWKHFCLYTSDKDNPHYISNAHSLAPQQSQPNIALRYVCFFTPVIVQWGLYCAAIKGAQALYRKLRPAQEKDEDQDGKDDQEQGESADTATQSSVSDFTQEHR